MTLIRHIVGIATILAVVGCNLPSSTTPEQSKPYYLVLVATTTPPRNSTVKLGDQVSVTLTIDYNMVEHATGPLYVALMCHLYTRLPTVWNAGLAYPKDDIRMEIPLQAVGKELVFEGDLGGRFCYDIKAGEVIDYVTLTFYERTDSGIDHIGNLDYGPATYLYWKITQ